MEKVKYTIVGIVPESVQKSFEKIKDNFNLPSDHTDIENHLILKDTAHFVIKKTFYLKDNVSEGDIINKIKQLDLEKKISLRCSTAGMFKGSPYGDILYAKIDENTELRALHMAIKKQIDNMVDTKNPEMEGEKYLPHLSIVYFLPSNISEEVKLYAEKYILPLEFELDQILLLKDFDSGKDEREILSIYKVDQE